MSVLICGREWRGKDGKDHRCVQPEHGTTVRCTCDCGDRIPGAKRPPLKLARWKRGRKVMES